jgi:hypothetical protein
LLNALAVADGLAGRVPVLLLPGEPVLIEAQTPADLVRALLRGDLPAFCVEIDGRMSRETPRRAAVLPGAFNPVHEGHWRLANTASRILDLAVVFELSVINVDKPALPAAEIRRRLQQFTWRGAVWATRAPTFAEKASLFPGAVFVVGADTAQRILVPRYYEHSERRMGEALEHIRRQGCRFLVAGREDRAGRYVGLEDLGLPEAYRELFTGIPKADFHVPLSSTLLRNQAATASSIAPPEGAE